MAAIRLCSIPDCGNPHKAKGLCDGHYRRLNRHGDPLGGRAPNGDPQRLFELSLSYEGDDCILWPYATHPNGYAQMRINGEAITVSRLICEKAHGAPPTPEHQSAHSCGNGTKGCITKRHLSWKTRSENEADKLSHGTDNRGSKHPLAKLTEADVLEIRSLKGKETQQSIADRFGVSNQQISDIQSGKAWAHTCESVKLLYR